MSAIEIKNLTKTYNGQLVVSNLSFSVEPGHIVGLLGPNGAGKTTTLRILLGLVYPNQGTATLNGQEFKELDNPVETVGAMLDRAGLHPGKTAYTHLRGLTIATGLPDNRIYDLIEFVGLADAGKKRIRQYSLGMRQRLLIATALIGDPDVLILDEPANGLDPQGIRWLRDLLKGRAAAGKTVLVSSHLLAELEQTVDSIVVINKGRLVKEGNLDQLRSNDKVTYVQSPELDKLLDLIKDQATEIKREDATTATVKGISSEEIAELAAANGIVVHQLRTEQQKLEDTFFELLEEHDKTKEEWSSISWSD